MFYRMLKFIPICLILILPMTGIRCGQPQENKTSWPMFHRDETHTGIAEGVGAIDAQAGPKVRWTYVVTPPPSEEDYSRYRWYSSFPLGDLDGDGMLEVIVTSADFSSHDSPAKVIALKDTPETGSGVTELWTFTVPKPTSRNNGVDQYSAALADADGDNLPDVFFSSKDGFVRAIKGTTGEVLWEYFTNHFIEAGPMVSDLNGDGSSEIIVVTDCLLGEGCPGSTSGGALYVFSAQRQGIGLENPPLWSLDFSYKLDSAEPAIADLDSEDGQNLKAIVIGSWGARLYVVWRNADGTIVQNSLDIRTLDSGPYHATPVIRSSPLLADFGEGWTAVFGWMPDPGEGQEARVSAVGLVADMKAGTVQFTKRWTINRDDWKSSVALLPIDPDEPFIVTGYGIGTDQGTGNYGMCDPVSGGILAVDPSGNVVWEDDFNGSEGNVRSSPAVVDIDGDTDLEVLITVGCYGKIHAYDGKTGVREWSYQLGERTIGTPSVGDLDNNGTLEIIVGSYDGKVYALGGKR